ncbi:MAG: glycosyltransferase family 4 protein [Candidatus Magasanikbacteria bacterium]|nr:glycosyltransferase family 4 protein [Candidatus Magasanikbacteria bacterium]
MIIGIDASLVAREQRTGVESYAFQIITHLARIIPPEVEVRLYSDRAFPANFVQHIPAHWKQVILAWPPRFLWTQVRLSFEMIQHPPDILFTPGHVEPVIQPRAAVMMVHDVAAWRIPRAYSKFDRWYTLFLTMRAVRKNPVILTPSLFTKQELEQLVRERKISQKAEMLVIPHGHISRSLSTFATPAKLFARYGIDQNTRYILCVGRIEYKKNIDTILSAFEKLKSENSEYTTLKLVLAGKPGVGYEDVQTVIAHSRYRTDIIETGWLHEDELTLLLAHARVLAFVSRYEGFGFPILEALDLGVPVVASQGIGLEEVGGACATYVSSTDPDQISQAIHKNLSLSSAARLEFQAQAHAHALLYSWSRSAEATYSAITRAYEIAEASKRVI